MCPRPVAACVAPDNGGTPVQVGLRVVAGGAVPSIGWVAACGAEASMDPTLMMSGAELEGAWAASPEYTATMLFVPTGSDDVVQVTGATITRFAQLSTADPPERNVTLPPRSDPATAAVIVTELSWTTWTAGDATAVVVGDRDGWKYVRSDSAWNAAWPSASKESCAWEVPWGASE